MVAQVAPLNFRYSHTIGRQETRGGDGFFNPVARGQEEVTRIDMDRVDYWLGRGAQPTGRVAGLIKAARTVAE